MSATSVCDTRATAGQVIRLRLAAARARRSVLRMIRAAGSGHMGGAMSAMDLVVAVYGHAMRFDPCSPLDPDRDRFILSAGHKAMAQYAVLAEVGVVDPALLDTYGELGSRLPGHPDMHKLPGIEANTGALGHGLPIACGMAGGLRMRRSDARVFVLLGDGELPEGSNWEGAAIAAHHRLDNLTAIIDVNGLQISGPTQSVLDMGDVAAKFAAFGWATAQVDGNDMASIIAALDRLPLEPGRPSVLVARTVKAAGVLGQQGRVGSHYWRPTPDELRAAEQDVDRVVEDLVAGAGRLAPAEVGR